MIAGFPRSPATIAAAVISLIAAVFMNQGGAIGPSHYRLDFRLVADTAGLVNIVSEAGTEDLQAAKPYAGGRHEERMRFVLPYGELREVRLKFEGRGSVKVRQARVVTRKNRLIYAFEPSAFEAATGISELSRPSGGVDFQLVSSHDDIFHGVLCLRPDRTLELRPVSRWWSLLLWFSVSFGACIILGLALRRLPARWRGRAREKFLSARTTFFGGDRPPDQETLPEPSPRPWRDAALYCAAALVILWVRRPDAFANPQLWAEDGMVFFLDDLRLGTEAWVTPYAGYLHAFPRLTAWLGGKVDPCLVPGLYTGCWIALTLAVVARTFSNRLRLPAKGLLGLAIVAVPHTGEVYMNITNVQWITAFLLFQLSLMEDPRIARQAVCDALALVGAGLSGPFCILLWPLFVWRYWHTRSRASLAFLAAMTLCAAIQGGSILQHRTESIGGDFAITQGLGMILRRTLGSLFLGPSTAQAFSPEVFVAAGGLALLAWLISSFRRSPLRTARLACWFAVVAIIVASSAKVRPDVWEPTNMHDGDRYFFVPKVLLLWLLILELGNPSRRFVGTCLLALTFAMNGSTFCLPALPDLRWHDYCGRIRNNEAVVVPINPPGWQIPVPGKNP